MTGLAVLAANNFGDTRSGGLAGPMALLIILLLAVATVLLIRNMNARLRRLPDRFPSQEGPAEGPAQEGSAQDSRGAPDPPRSEQADRADRNGRV